MSANPRICIIGNSHIAALRAAMKADVDLTAGYDVTFFGAEGTSMRSLTRRGQHLVSDDELVRKSLALTSGGLKHIDLASFDVIVLYSMLNLRLLVDWCWRRAREDAPVLTPDQPWLYPYSEAEIAADVLNRSTTGYVLGLLQDRVADTVVVAAPYPSERILLGDSQRARLWRRLFEGGTAAGELTKEARHVLSAWNAYLARNNILVQPEESISGSVFTTMALATDGLFQGHLAPPGDYYHMNAKYGALMFALVLRHCRERIESARARSSSTHHPYQHIPDERHWMRGVASRDPLDIPKWYTKKFSLDGSRIATAGSCFAQHIGRHLKAAGFRFVDTEPAPDGMSDEALRQLGYGVYSARFGNIYTPRQLLQLIERAYGRFTPSEDYWTVRDGVVDPFRPTIQAEAFASVAQMRVSRDAHLAAVRQMFESTDVLIFTLGLTETWVSKVDGAVFPVAPGVVAGEFDESRHGLLNQSFEDVLQDLRLIADKLTAAKTKLILSVSPVPLMATATPLNVIVATTYSKAVLRAAAGQVALNRPNIDYFPSFEIISSHVTAGQYYESDKRSVTEAGVRQVMRQFFIEHRPPSGEMPSSVEDEGVVCDEMLLAAFRSPTK